MIHIAERMSVMAPSPTLELNTKAAQLRRSGLGVLNFSVGEPDYAPPPEVVDTAVAALRAGRYRYGPAGGSRPLREAIARKFWRDNQVQYDPDQIVVGCGAKEILFHLFLATLNPGDEVLLPAPYWVSYGDQIRAAGATVRVVPVQEHPLGVCYDTTVLDAMCGPQTRCLIVCNPHNPSGTQVDAAALGAVSDWAASRGLWLVVDEIYEYLSFDGPHVCAASLGPKAASRCVVINGLSKGYAMTGWRVGYMAGPMEVAAKVRILQSHSSTCLPPFIEDAAITALEAGPERMQPQVAELARARDLARELATSRLGVPMMNPTGAFYLFLDLRTALRRWGSGDPHGSLAFCAALLEREQVAVVPGEAFGTPGFVRLSYALPRAQIEEGFVRIGRLLSQSCPDRPPQEDR